MKCYRTGEKKSTILLYGFQKSENIAFESNNLI